MIPQTKLLTWERLKEVLVYYPESGEWEWRRPTSNRCAKERFLGARAGDYLLIGIDGVTHKVHRLAWFYMTGKWPEADVDHRDLNGMNNRWENLRAATRSQNNYNSRLSRKNTTGYKGIYFDKRISRWAARIRIEGRQKSLGSYSNPHEAAAAYRRAAVEFHGEFYRG